MNIKKLDWPHNMKTNGFFSDFPVLGSNAMLYRKFRKILGCRTEQCLTDWPDKYVRSQVRIELSDCISQYFDWPNSFFLPNDNIGVLTWDPSMDMRDVDFGLYLEKKYGVNVHIEPKMDFMQFINKVKISNTSPFFSVN